MAKTMLINMAEPEECRIAVVDDNHLEEVYLERDFENQHVGNIYLGRVMNIEPSMQAAFIDYGAQRNGFLHVSDVCFDAILSPAQMKSLGIIPQGEGEKETTSTTPKKEEAPKKAKQGEASEESKKTEKVVKKTRKIIRKKVSETSEAKEDSQTPKRKVKRVVRKVKRKSISAEEKSVPVDEKGEKSPKVKRVVKKRIVRKKVSRRTKASDNTPSEEGVSLKKPQENRRHRSSRNSKTASDKSRGVSRKSIRIQDALKPGQMIIVQVSREAIDHKGASLTTYLSLAGRTLVLMPYQNKTGISRKIQGASERQKLRQILTELKPPKNMGFIIRTSGVGKTQNDFDRDLKVLCAHYEKIKKAVATRKKPGMIYEESDLAIRVLRDVYSDDIKSIIIDNQEGEKKVNGWLRSMIPGAAKRLHLHSESRPLFTKFNIEEDFEKLFHPRVELPSGATLVIEQTEAFVSIDVNTARMKDKDQNAAIFKTNQEAAVAIPRQLRLRDLGGLIVCDFIDMVISDHKRDIEKIFQKELAKDRSRVKCSRISQFGLIEVSRQRMRQSVERATFESCPACSGYGKVKNESSVALKILREIRGQIGQKSILAIRISAHNKVIDFLQNQKRRKILDLEEKFDKIIHLHSDSSYRSDEFLTQYYDRDNKLIEIK